MDQGPLIPLFAGSFRHEVLDEGRIDEIKFDKPVVIEEIYVIPNLCRPPPHIIRLLPNFEGSTTPENPSIRVFVKPLDNLSASRFEEIMPTFRFGVSRCRATPERRVRTDHVVLQGCYSHISLCLTGMVVEEPLNPPEECVAVPETDAEASSVQDSCPGSDVEPWKAELAQMIKSDKTLKAVLDGNVSTSARQSVSKPPSSVEDAFVELCQLGQMGFKDTRERDTDFLQTLNRVTELISVLSYANDCSSTLDRELTVPLSIAQWAADGLVASVRFDIEWVEVQAVLRLVSSIGRCGGAGVVEFVDLRGLELLYELIVAKFTFSSFLQSIMETLQEVLSHPVAINHFMRKLWQEGTVLKDIGEDRHTSGARSPPKVGDGQIDGAEMEVDTDHRREGRSGYDLVLELISTPQPLGVVISGKRMLNLAYLYTSCEEFHRTVSEIGLLDVDTSAEEADGEMLSHHREDAASEGVAHDVGGRALPLVEQAVAALDEIATTLHQFSQPDLPLRDAHDRLVSRWKQGGSVEYLPRLWMIRDSQGPLAYSRFERGELEVLDIMQVLEGTLLLLSSSSFPGDVATSFDHPPSYPAPPCPGTFSYNRALYNRALKSASLVWMMLLESVEGSRMVLSSVACSLLTRLWSESSDGPQPDEGTADAAIDDDLSEVFYRERLDFFYDCLSSYGELSGHPMTPAPYSLRHVAAAVWAHVRASSAVGNLLSVVGGYSAGGAGGAENGGEQSSLDDAEIILPLCELKRLAATPAGKHAVATTVLRCGALKALIFVVGKAMQGRRSAPAQHAAPLVEIVLRHNSPPGASAMTTALCGPAVHSAFLLIDPSSLTPEFRLSVDLILAWTRPALELQENGVEALCNLMTDVARGCDEEEQEIQSACGFGQTSTTAAGEGGAGKDISERERSQDRLSREDAECDHVTTADTNLPNELAGGGAGVIGGTSGANANADEDEPTVAPFPVDLSGLQPVSAVSQSQAQAESSFQPPMSERAPCLWDEGQLCMLTSAMRLLSLATEDRGLRLCIAANSGTLSTLAFVLERIATTLSICLSVRIKEEYRDVLQLFRREAHVLSLASPTSDLASACIRAFKEWSASEESVGTILPTYEGLMPAIVSAGLAIGSVWHVPIPTSVPPYSPTGMATLSSEAWHSIVRLARAWTCDSPWETEVISSTDPFTLQPRGTTEPLVHNLLRRGLTRPRLYHASVGLLHDILPSPLPRCRPQDVEHNPETASSSVHTRLGKVGDAEAAHLATIVGSVGVPAVHETFSRCAVRLADLGTPASVAFIGGLLSTACPATSPIEDASFNAETLAVSARALCTLARISSTPGGKASLLEVSGATTLLRVLQWPKVLRKEGKSNLGEESMFVNGQDRVTVSRVVDEMAVVALYSLRNLCDPFLALDPRAPALVRLVEDRPAVESVGEITRAVVDCLACSGASNVALRMGFNTLAFLSYHAVSLEAVMDALLRPPEHSLAVDWCLRCKEALSRVVEQVAWETAPRGELSAAVAASRHPTHGLEALKAVLEWVDQVAHVGPVSRLLQILGETRDQSNWFFGKILERCPEPDDLADSFVSPTHQLRLYVNRTRDALYAGDLTSHPDVHSCDPTGATENNAISQKRAELKLEGQVCREHQPSGSNHPADLTSPSEERSVGERKAPFEASATTPEQETQAAHMKDPAGRDASTPDSATDRYVNLKSQGNPIAAGVKTGTPCEGGASGALIGNGEGVREDTGNSERPSGGSSNTRAGHTGITNAIGSSSATLPQPRPLAERVSKRACWVSYGDEEEFLVFDEDEEWRLHARICAGEDSTLLGDIPWGQLTRWAVVDAASSQLPTATVCFDPPPEPDLAKARRRSASSAQSTSNSMSGSVHSSKRARAPRSSALAEKRPRKGGSGAGSRNWRQKWTAAGSSRPPSVHVDDFMAGFNERRMVHGDPAPGLAPRMPVTPQTPMMDDALGPWPPEIPLQGGGRGRSILRDRWSIDDHVIDPSRDVNMRLPPEHSHPPLGDHGFLRTNMPIPPRDDLKGGRLLGSREPHSYDGGCGRADTLVDLPHRALSHPFRESPGPDLADLPPPVPPHSHHTHPLGFDEGTGQAPIGEMLGAVPRLSSHGHPHAHPSTHTRGGSAPLSVMHSMPNVPKPMRRPHNSRGRRGR